LEQPLTQVFPTTTFGTFGRYRPRLNTRSGNERFAHAAYVDYDRVDGARPNRADESGDALMFAKLAVNSASDLFFSVSDSKNNYGEQPDVQTTFGFGSHTPITIRQFTDTPDPSVINKSRITEGLIGFKHLW